MNSNERDTIV